MINILKDIKEIMQANGLDCYDITTDPDEISVRLYIKDRVTEDYKNPITVIFNSNKGTTVIDNAVVRSITELEHCHGYDVNELRAVIPIMEYFDNNSTEIKAFWEN